MPGMVWKDTYSVGVPKIDADHQQIIEMINKAHCVCLDGASDDCINKIVQDMKKYAKSHFQMEEKLMSEYNYPDVEAHLAEHHYFWNKAEKISEAWDNGVPPDITELYRFLSIWLVSHIVGADKKLGTFLVENGMTESI